MKHVNTTDDCNVDQIELFGNSVLEEPSRNDIHLGESDFEEVGLEYSEDSSDFESDQGISEDSARSGRVQKDIEEKEKQLAEVDKEIEKMKNFLAYLKTVKRGSEDANQMKNIFNRLVQEHLSKH